MKAKTNRSGFSMIEMLVAAAIMVVLVMMLSMLFQGTSQSWRIGVQRAGTYSMLRSLVGSIQRDANAAVDEATIDRELRDELGGSQDFEGLRFFTLTGSGTDPKALRSPTFVSYNGTVRRETKLTGDGSKVTKSAEIVPAGSVSINYEKFTEGTSSKGLPLYVKIRASCDYFGGRSLDIGAGSAGPDKAWNTKDDIKTWVVDK